MKYFTLVLLFQFFTILGFSQEKKDTLVKTATPQPLRMEVSKSNSTQLSSAKQKTPINKRVSATDAINNKVVNSKGKTPENIRIKNK